MALRTLSRSLYLHTRFASLRRITSISTRFHLSPEIPTTRSFATSQASSSDTDKDPNRCRPKDMILSGRDGDDHETDDTDLEDDPDWQPQKRVIVTGNYGCKTDDGHSFEYETDGCDLEDETEGRDFEHWLVWVEEPQGEPTRDEIISSYITTLAQVLGSEEKARMKIYSVSTRHYFAFGALVSEEISWKLKELPGVRYVISDSYIDAENKDYGGEPFINGKAVPYDPKYHAEWLKYHPIEPPVTRPNHQGKYTVLELNTMNWTCNKSPQVLVPIADGTEEMEATIIINVLRQAKAEVTVASVGDKLEILASRRAKLVADILLDEAAECSYDLIVLPGGLGGAETFANSAKLLKMLKTQTESTRPYGAISASPALVLEPHGLLKGKKATAFPAMCNKLTDQSEIHHGVVIDGNLITGRGAGNTMEFSLAIVEKLFGRSRALEIAGVTLCLK